MGNKKILNRTTMQIGLGAAAGISIVANFQKNDKNLFYVHWCGIVLTLGLGAVYQCMQVSRENHLRHLNYDLKKKSHYFNFNP